MVMTLYFDARKATLLERLHEHRNIDGLSLKMDETLMSKLDGRNLHIVVLESFLNPEWFTKLKFNIGHAHPDFKALIGNSIGIMRSPAFGGNTSQAEFEILCGVPAFGAIDGNEFNTFSGSETYCMPHILKQAGYTTIASQSFRPDFYNSALAYKSMGFSEIYFPKTMPLSAIPRVYSESTFLL